MASGGARRKLWEPVEAWWKERRKTGLAGFGSLVT